MNLEATQRQPVARLTREISIILIGTILLTLSAKIAVPFYPVPMSTQTLVVLGLGLFLGPVRSSLVVAAYLLEGLFGLPVFAGTPPAPAGLAYFAGPTGGFLIGFALAAAAAGWREYPEFCVSCLAHAGFRYGHALKRSSNMIANWLRAANHSLTFLPPFSKFLIAR